MNKYYEITKVTRWYQESANATSYRTLKHGATLEEVLSIAKRQCADIDELMEDLQEMGCSSCKGYMFSEE